VVETDERGFGWFSVRGAAPGGTRLHLTAGPDDRPCDPEAPGSAETAYDNDDRLGFWAAAGCVNVRVLPDDWHLDAVGTDEVTFDLVYREIFAYYELLHSFMKDEVFSLADECKVRTYSRLVWQMCDPVNWAKTYYMPPTRDMSLPKARLLLRFMRAQQATSDVPLLVPSRRATADGISRRGQLWDALKVAATVELAATLQYLFAAYSVPHYGAASEYVRRGLWTPEQRTLACGDGGQTRDGGMRGTLLTVAREEMIHFLLVNNIIMAMGEAFYVPPVDFGTLNSTLPVPLNLALEPVGPASVQRFIELERPESEVAEVRRGAAGPALATAASAASDGPDGPDAGPGYGSISELYADIREGIQRVPDVFMVRKGRGGGEHHLFLRESINAVHPDFQLEVDDVASALFAVDVITEQGEGNSLASVALPGVPPSGDSHYELYLRMAEQLTARRSDGRAWEPAYPVARNPTVRTDAPNRTTVTDAEAVAVMDLFNRSYFLMLQLMVQHFGWTPDASLRRSKLMNAAIDVMTGMMSPLAEELVTMPSGRRGLTAGPSFELTDPVLYNSRPDIAMQSVALRFDHLGIAARKCDAVPERVGDMYDFYADYFRRFEVPGRPR
jgi:hypothetical protein